MPCYLPRARVELIPGWVGVVQVSNPTEVEVYIVLRFVWGFYNRKKRTIKKVLDNNSKPHVTNMKWS